MNQISQDQLEWVREEILIEGGYYPNFESRTEKWCYTLHPLVKPKNSEPIGYHFAGWAKKSGSVKRFRIEGNAETVGECIGICEGHLRHICSID